MSLLFQTVLTQYAVHSVTQHWVMAIPILVNPESPFWVSECTILSPAMVTKHYNTAFSPGLFKLSVYLRNHSAALLTITNPRSKSLSSQPQNGVTSSLLVQNTWLSFSVK